MDGGLAQHIPSVYRLALRLTQNIHSAEDLTQETFLRAWQRTGQLKERKAVRAWLFRIAVNLANDEFRRSKTTLRRAQGLPEELNCPRPAPDLAAESNDELVHALKLLDSLPTRQRVVLFLTAVEDFSLSEVCKILDITMNAAKANLSLARQRMRDELEKHASNVERTIPRSLSNDTTVSDD